MVRRRISCRTRTARDFLRFFKERCERQGFFIFDEPESPCRRRVRSNSSKLIQRMDRSGLCQVIMATHAPMLMAYPNACLLRLTPAGLEPVAVAQTDHYRLMREFFDDPATFIKAALEP